MQLQLVYNENQAAPVDAALFAGANVGDWLAEISSWEPDLRALRCFIVPENINSAHPGGLFVIFKHQAIASGLSLRSAYTEVAPGFYIPVHSTLYPAVTAAELSRFKLWEVQVFHPSAGLSGFEAKDELHLADLVAISEISKNRWLNAPITVNSYPRLNSIRLEPEESPFDPSSLFEQLPLEDIPDAEGDRHTPLAGFARVLSMLVLWLLLIPVAIAKILFALIRALLGKGGNRPVRPGGAGVPGGTGGIGMSGGVGSPRKPGRITRLEDWINKSLQDLRKQRDSELNRLVNMFDNDDDDALKYAIPLDSPYLNRGVAPPSGKLTSRPTDFSLRGLGGGGKVDYWDLGEYRTTLRQHYMKTLNAALERGDYKKAAYIYAHLLGDLNMAARTLQDGKHYREAAAIYKDHLKNNAKAAECLENGGLLDEAIPIYIELGSYEKVGDLYKQLGHDEQATKYYDDTVQRFVDAKDYLNAARLKTEKMEQPEAGRNILLDGWKDDNKPEVCLVKYMEQGEAENLPDEVKAIYERHVSLKRRTDFLNVLAGFSSANPEERLRQTAVEISYDVVHRQIKRGDHSGLRLLHQFQQEDKLLSQDTGRYISQNQQRRPLRYVSTSYLELRRDTQWVDIVNYHDQVIAVGKKDDELYLLRGNWEGKADHELLFRFAAPNYTFRLTADGHISPQVLLTGEDIPAQGRMKLDVGLYFEKALSFDYLNWQLPNTLGYCQKPNEPRLYVLHIVSDQLCMDLFSLDGHLITRTYCLEGKEKQNTPDLASLCPSKIYWRKDHFYFMGRDSIMRLTEDGQLEVMKLRNTVINFSISEPHAALKIAVLTDLGCVIITPELKKMEVASAGFATNMGACYVQLLQENRVVVANQSLARVHDISSPIPKLICEIQPENKIMKILTVPKRNHFALLEADNRISTHMIEDEV